MADISNVDNTTIKDLYERLESLSCTSPLSSKSAIMLTTFCFSSDYDTDIILRTSRRIEASHKD